MISTFLLTLTILIGPILLIINSNTRFKEKAFFLLPIGFVVQLSAVGCFDAILTRWVSYGWTKIALVAGISSVFSYLLIWLLEKNISKPRRPIYSTKLLCIVAGITFLGICDSFLILANQGWESVLTPQGKQLIPYFRFPFNTDGQRNVVMINALIRQEGSPFLLGSPTMFESLWHHLGALVTAPFLEASNFSNVSGVSLSLSFVFFFVVFWSIAWLRPGLLLRPIPGLILALLVLTHADVYHFVASWLGQQQAGIEADGSFAPYFLRNFSLKVATLTSPASTMSLIFMACFLVFRTFSLVRHPIVSLVFQGLCFTAAFLSAPLVALLFFAAYLAHTIIVKIVFQQNLTLDLAHFGAFSVVAFGACFVCFNYSLIEVFSRPVPSNIIFTVFSPLKPGQWLTIPLVLIGSIGIVGIIAITILVERVRAKQWSFFWGEILGVLVGGALFFNYVVTSGQVRSYFAIVASLIGIYFIVTSLPSARRMNKTPMWRNLGLGGGALCLCLHLYAVYCFIGKPSSFAAGVSWGDYFKMNRSISERYANMPVIAARSSQEYGLDLPLVMESTTSFSLPAHAALYGKMSPRQRAVMFKLNHVSLVAPYTYQLGYRGIVWGPVEQSVWGDKVKKRFVGDAPPLIQHGTVALYELRDHLKLKFRNKLAKDGTPTEAYLLSLAKALEKDEWWQETVDAYYQLLTLNAEDKDVRVTLARLLNKLGKPKEAIEHLAQVLQTDPKNAEVHNYLGMAFMKLRRIQDAVKLFEKAVEFDPKFVTAYNNLGALYVLQMKFDKANKTLRKALKISPRDPQVHLNLGRSYLGQLELKKAKYHYKKALRKKKGADLDLLRREAYFGLGDVYVQEGELGKAYENYKKVIDIEPSNVFAHVKAGQMLFRQNKPNPALNYFREALKLDPRNQSARLGLNMVRAKLGGQVGG